MIQVPRATYRLQLNAEFTFRDATALVPYLARLGISHVYCSPYFRARPGSMHGYDVVDHNSFNPEIGTREDFEALRRGAARAPDGPHRRLRAQPRRHRIGQRLVDGRARERRDLPVCAILRHRLVGHRQAAHSRARRDLWRGARARRAAAAARCRDATRSRCSITSIAFRSGARTTIARERYLPAAAQPSPPSCTSLLEGQAYGSPTGASRQMRSTTGASSTSTSLRRCAWRTTKSSKRPTGCCWSWSTRARSTACASIIRTGCTIRRATSRSCRSAPDRSICWSRRSSRASSGCPRPGRSAAPPGTTSPIP